MEDDGAYLNQNVCIKPIYHTHTTIVCYRHTSALSLPYLAFPASTYLPSPFSFNHSISIQILHSSPRYNILFNMCLTISADFGVLFISVNSRRANRSAYAFAFASV